MSKYLDISGLEYLWGKIKIAFSSKADKSESIKNITRSGTTFTVTRADNTTFTFDQQATSSMSGVTIEVQGSTLVITPTNEPTVDSNGILHMNSQEDIIIIDE